MTADDFDARISYSNDSLFTTPNPSDASLRAQYSEYLDGTYHATSTANASLSYLFQGTSVYIYSAQGPSFGSVAIDLDGNSTIVSAYASNNLTVQSGLLNYLLFSASGLEMGSEHNLTMTNLGAVNKGEGNEMLLDYITTTVQLAPAGATVTNHTIEDTNLTALNYTGQWGQNSDSLFSGGTSHYTNDSTAAVSFSFYGTAMYIYGDQNNDHGAFEVELDGESETLRTPLGCGGVFRSGYCEKTNPGAQYFKAYLGPELHNVTIRNVNLNQSLRYSPSGNAPTFVSYFDLDRIVYTTPSEYLSVDASGSSGSGTSGIGGAAAAGSNGETGAAAASFKAGTSGLGLTGTAALATTLLYTLLGI